MKKLLKRKPVITDPVRHAEEMFGVPCRAIGTLAPWKRWVPFCTTGQFAAMDRGYRRHCGPTAITNVILAVSRKYRYTGELVPADVFHTVSEIGRKKGIYWNTDILGMIGGTSDMLTWKYIRDCLKAYRIPLSAADGRPAIRVRERLLPRKREFLRAIRAGHLLYLQLQHHPCYGNHHLLCCGFTVVSSMDGKRKEVYLLLADGWGSEPRYLPLSKVGLCHFCEIGL